MKKSLVLAALLATSFAHANIVVVPTAEGCAEAKKNNNKVIMAACAKMAKGEPVDLAIPLQGGTKTK
jgi:hypothetical protein